MNQNDRSAGMHVLSFTGYPLPYTHQGKGKKRKEKKRKEKKRKEKNIISTFK
jgi:hypothetical protein